MRAAGRRNRHAVLYLIGCGGGLPLLWCRNRQMRQLSRKDAAMTFLDRIATILITATVTSAAWIVAGGSVLDLADSSSQIARTRPADAQPSPKSSDAPAVVDAAGTKVSAASLETDDLTAPNDTEAQQIIVPVLNVRPSDLSDTFSDDRGGGKQIHHALDIMAPEGTTVVAAAPGKIEKMFRSQVGGNTLYVRSADGRTIYYYAHLAEYAPGMKEGQKIRRGQRLGAVGHTGNASEEAPHLHFAIMRTTADAEWWEASAAVNPYPILTGKRSK